MAHPLANNTAVRLGAAALVGGLVVYLVWAATSSSSPSAPSSPPTKDPNHPSTKTATLDSAPSRSSRAEKRSKDDEHFKGSTQDAQRQHPGHELTTAAKDSVQVDRQSDAASREDDMIEGLSESELPKEPSSSTANDNLAQEELQIQHAAVDPTELLSVEPFQTGDHGDDQVVSSSNDQGDIDPIAHHMQGVESAKAMAADTLSTTEAVATTASPAILIAKEEANGHTGTSSAHQHHTLNKEAPVFVPSWIPQPVSATGVKLQSNVSSNAQGTLDQRQKMKSRCRFWPHCTNKACKFTHPTLPCRDPGNCAFGDRCNYIHPRDLERQSSRGSKKSSRGPSRTEEPRHPQSSSHNNNSPST